MLVKINKGNVQENKNTPRLGEIRMFNQAFKPSPAWKLENKYSNFRCGPEARAASKTKAK